MATRQLAGTRTHQNLKDAFAPESRTGSRQHAVTRVPPAEVPVGASEEGARASAANVPARSRMEYARMAKEAREEGFVDIAEWFETLARTARSHTGHLDV